MKFLIIALSLVLSSCSFLINEKSADKNTESTTVPTPIPPAPQTYSVVITGNASLIAGMPADASNIVAGTVLTLTASPPTGFRVSHWVGACESITSNICSFTVSANLSVSVVLEAIPPAVRQLTLEPVELASLTYQIDDEPQITVESSTTISVTEGQSVLIFANLVSNAEITNWINSYGSSPVFDSYGFIMPNEDVFASPEVQCRIGYEQNGSECGLGEFKIIAPNLSITASLNINVHDSGYTMDEYYGLDFYMNEAFVDLNNYDFEDYLTFEVYSNDAVIVGIDNCESQGGTLELVDPLYAYCEFEPEIRPTLPLIVLTEQVYYINLSTVSAMDDMNQSITMSIDDLSLYCEQMNNNCYYQGPATNQLMTVRLSSVPDVNSYNFIGWRILDPDNNILQTFGPDQEISVMFDKNMQIETIVEQYVDYKLRVSVAGGYDLEHIIVTEDGGEIEDCYGTCEINLKGNSHEIQITPITNGGSAFEGFTIGQSSIVQPTYSFNSTDPVNNGQINSHNEFSIQANFANSQRISTAFQQQHLSYSQETYLAAKYYSSTTMIKTVGDDLFYLDQNSYTVNHSSISNIFGPTTSMGSLSDANFQIYNGHGPVQNSMLTGKYNGPLGFGKYIFNLDYSAKTLNRIGFLSACQESSPPFVSVTATTGFLYCAEGYTLKVYSYTLDFLTNSMITNKIYDTADNPGDLLLEIIGSNKHGLLFSGVVSGGATRIVFLKPDGSMETGVKNFNWTRLTYFDEDKVYMVTDNFVLYKFDLSVGLSATSTRAIPVGQDVAFSPNYVYVYWGYQGRQIRRLSLDGFNSTYYGIADQDTLNCYPMSFRNQTTTVRDKFQQIPILISCNSDQNNGTYKIFMIDENYDKIIKLVDVIRGTAGVDIQTSLRLDNNILFLSLENIYQHDYTQLFKIDLNDVKKSREILKVKPSFVLAPSGNPVHRKNGLDSQTGLRASDSRLYYTIKQKDQDGTETGGVPDSEETTVYSIDISP